MNSEPSARSIEGHSLDLWWCVQNDQIELLRCIRAKPQKPRNVWFPSRLSVNILNLAEGVVKVFKVEKERHDPALNKGKRKSPGGKNDTKGEGR